MMQINKNGIVKDKQIKRKIRLEEEESNF